MEWSGCLEIGLIDEIGGLEDAIESAAELSELEDYRIITLPNKKDEFDEFLKKLTIEQNIYLKKMMNFSEEVLRNLKLINSEDKIQTILPYFIEIY